MSTRSIIGIVEPTGLIRAVTCHYDGYPAGVGKKLLQHYADADAVRALLALGDLSALEPTIEESEFYARDRGETLSPPIEITPDDAAILGRTYYAYLWDVNASCWMWSDALLVALRPLTNADCGLSDA